MRISVVIPAFNAAEWLPGAVTSLRRQTRPPADIVIVDDGSTDATAAVARELGSDIRLVQQENRGLAAARNAGEAAATGDWLVFLDADDRLFPHALDALAASTHAPGIGLAYGFVLARIETPEKARLHSFPYAVGVPPHPAEAHFWWNAITTPGAALIKRSLHRDVGGFDEAIRHLEDGQYWMRCGMISAFAHCDTVVLDKSWTTTSLGASFGRNAWFRIKAQRRFLSWCRQRGFDTSFLGLRPGSLTDHALRRILHLREWSFLDAVLGEARADGNFGYWYWNAWLRRTLLRLSGNLPAPYVPPSIPDEVTGVSLPPGSLVSELR